MFFEGDEIEIVNTGPLNSRYKPGDRAVIENIWTDNSPRRYEQYHLRMYDGWLQSYTTENATGCFKLINCYKKGAV